MAAVWTWPLAGATLGTVVPVPTGASDLVFDEQRGRLYLVAPSLNQVLIYSLRTRQFLPPVRTGQQPLSAALSADRRVLYVTAHEASALNAIDLESFAVSSVSLPARPEGVAVGRDGRVLISTIGTGPNNLSNVLLLYDPGASGADALRAVQLTPPPPSPPQLPPPSGRIFLSSRSQLLASNDGSLIVGVNMPSNTLRAVFVYEVASATVLRSRAFGNISSVLSISPDGKRFLSGLTLFDVDTLNVLAQQNLANAPYPFPAGVNFSTQENQGGSVFSPDGSVLYSAFNIAPVQTPPGRPNVSQLMLNDPENLLIRTAIQLPENLVGRMVISSDGSTIYALSESGFLIIPVGAISQNPIAVPETTAVLLANDQCGVTSSLKRAVVPIRNEGRGRLTAQVQLLQAAPAGPGGLGGPGGPGGGAPGGGVIIIIPPGQPGGPPGGMQPPPAPFPGLPQAPQNPGIMASAPQALTRATPDGVQAEFMFTNAAAAQTPGTVLPTHTYVVQSNEAINIPASIRVFQNYRNAEARGEIVPIPTGLSANEALEDMVYDRRRQRIYIANSGLNRVEVFDTRSGRLLPPIRVGQLPRSLALSPDGTTLYVANSGGESVSLVDADRLTEIARVRFPPIPFNFNAPLVTPSVIAATMRGALVVMNNGTIWRIVGGEAVPRPLSPVIGSLTLPAPRTMAATPEGDYVIILAGNGFVYLYDALADEFIQSRQVFTNPIQGFFGPVTAGPRGAYFVVNGTVLNQSLTPVSSAGTVPGGGNQALVRPVAAVASSGSGSLYARMVQPIRTSANVVVAEPPQIELVDANSGLALRSVPALEGPLSVVVGNQRVNINGRTMALDASGMVAYALTTSGLSIIPLDPLPLVDRSVINNNGVVSLASYLPAMAPGSLISLFGRNLGRDETLTTTPVPTILGGVCVTMNNRALPLLMTSTYQINAQVPVETTPGRYTIVVRSVEKKTASLPQQVTVTRTAPAIFADPESKRAAIFHLDGEPVTPENPARRDELLMLYATGLGPTKGEPVQTGMPAPGPPYAVTDRPEVFFGDPRYQQSEMIVEWSGLVPGLVGVYQVNVRVPGFRMRGKDLPVTLRIGGAESQTSGPVGPPLVAVE